MNLVNSANDPSPFLNADDTTTLRCQAATRCTRTHLPARLRSTSLLVHRSPSPLPSVVLGVWARSRVRPPSSVRSSPLLWRHARISSGCPRTGYLFRLPLHRLRWRQSPECQRRMVRPPCIHHHQLAVRLSWGRGPFHPLRHQNPSPSIPCDQPEKHRCCSPSHRHRNPCILSVVRQSNCRESSCSSRRHPPSHLRQCPGIRTSHTRWKFQPPKDNYPLRRHINRHQYLCHLRWWASLHQVVPTS